METVVTAGYGGNPYVWESAISFQLLDELMEMAFQEKTVDIFLTSLTCQYNFTSAALDWVVCDCSEENGGILLLLFTIIIIIIIIICNYSLND